MATTNTSTASNTPSSAFKAAYPLSLFAHDGQNQPVMPITLKPEEQVLIVEIANTQAGDYQIAIPTGNATPLYQIELRFRPGTLLTPDKITCTSSDKDTFTVSYQQQKDGSQSLYLLGQQPMIWNGQGTTITLTLSNFVVNGASGSRNTLIQLNYDALTTSTGTNKLSGSRTQIMQIVQKEGISTAPFFFGPIGANQVLCDGKTSNTIELALAPIQNSGIQVTTESSFKITFLNPQHASDPWALASTSELFGMEVTPPDGWKVTSPVQGAAEATWTFQATTAATLIDPLSILFNNLISSEAPGGAKIALNYANIAGYADGELATLVDKYQTMIYTQGSTFYATNAISIDHAAADQKAGISLPFPKGNNNGLLIGDTTGTTDHAGVFICMPQNPGGWPLQIMDGNKQTTFSVDFQGDVASAGRYQDKTGQVMPVGAIISYGGTTPPAGWLLCDGSTIAAQYTELIEVLGKNTTPDLRSRFVVGAGQGDGLSSYALGATAGEEIHVLSEAELPSHTHEIAYITDTSGTGSSDSDRIFCSNKPGSTNQFTAAAGSNQGHNNLPPYYALTYIVKC